MLHKCTWMQKPFTEPKVPWFVNIVLKCKKHMSTGVSISVSKSAFVTLYESLSSSFCKNKMESNLLILATFY